MPTPRIGERVSLLPKSQNSQYRYTGKLIRLPRIARARASLESRFIFFFLRKIWWVNCFSPLPIFRRSGGGPVSIESLHLKDTGVSGCAVRALRLHAWWRRSTEGIDKTVQSAKAQSESVALLAADLRVPSVGPQPQHIASFNQATYSIT